MFRGLQDGKGSYVTLKAGRPVGFPIVSPEAAVARGCHSPMRFC